MAVFCVMSSVMYSKFVIEDYSGKRPILLFSYPVSRKKVILSKLSVVSGVTIISMIVSNLLVFMTFGITENFIHLVGKDFTLPIMLKVVENTLIMSLIAASIGIVAVGIGFIKIDTDYHSFCSTYCFVNVQYSDKCKLKQGNYVCVNDSDDICRDSIFNIFD